MKWLAYDLEACFLAKGGKREIQRILEIGMVKGNKRFQRLVNPVGDGDIIETLESKGQDSNKTINFWTKLLCEKKYLNTAVRRKSIPDKALAIRKLLDTNEDFVSEEKALQEAVEFGKDVLWIAHNGKGFDNRIMSGYMKRLGLPIPKFEDSLPMLRKKINIYSYSQPNIYKHMFNKAYMAHHALEDALALRKILRYVARSNFTSVVDLFAPGLRSIKGIGPCSEKILNRNGINSINDLARWVDNHDIDEWNKKMRIYNYKKIGKKLFQHGIMSLLKD